MAPDDVSPNLFRTSGQHSPEAMARARQVQVGMMPQAPKLPGYEFASDLQMCEDVGGDFYDFFPVSPHEMGIVVGDVAGHGVDAALVMVAAKKAMQFHSQGLSSPRDALLLLNDNLRPELPPRVFVTVHYAVLDLRTHRLTIARAGHSPAILCNPERDPLVRTLDSRGMVVGVSSSEHLARALEETTVKLQPGDIVFTYTDGIIEAMGPGGKRYGEQRLMEVIAEFAQTKSDLATLISNLRADLQRFTGGEPLSDDLTLLAMRFNGAPRDHTQLVTLRPLAAARPNNLPSPATSFIGRDAELKDLTGILGKEGPQLVTVTGPGGTGKTRFSQRLGHHLLDLYPGGCWFADLTEAQTTEAVADKVAQAFGVALTSNESASQQVAYILEHRKPLLLIIDNFEQVVECAAATVGVWRKRAPHVRFLVTSRALLGLAGEQEYELGPLPVPPTARGTPAPDGTATDSEDAPLLPASGAGLADAIARYDAVKLFLDRARQAKPAFEITEDNAPDIARIVAELDGMPLAIELAAARVPILSPEQMVKKLGQKFQLLKSSRRDLTPRQQTLLGAIDWSYDMLSDWERRAFEQLSHFRGGFFLDAAEAVVDLSGFPDAPLTMDAVQSLREKSIVRVLDTPYEPRFAMYLALRDYANEKLRANKHEAPFQQLAQRHAEFYVNYVEHWNARVYSGDGLEALDRLEYEKDDIFAIQESAEAGRLGELVMAASTILSIALMLKIRGPADQRVPRLERALHALPHTEEELPPDSPINGRELRTLQARLLTELAIACHDLGDWNRAADLADRAVDKASPLDASRALAQALEQQAEMRRTRGDLAGAHASAEEAGTLYRELKVARGVASCVTIKGQLYTQWGDLDGALRCYEEGLATCRAAGDRDGEAFILNRRGLLLLRRGDLREAAECFETAEEYARELNNRAGLAYFIANRGSVLTREGNFDDALACFREAEMINRETGNRRGIAACLSNRAAVYLREGDLDRAASRYELAEGIYRALGSKSGLAGATMGRAEVAFQRGDLRAALAGYQEAEQTYRNLGDKTKIALAVGHRGEALGARGEAEPALAALREALAMLREVGATRTPAYFEFQAAQASAEDALGRREEARRIAKEAHALAVHFGYGDDHPDESTRTHLAKLNAILQAE